MAAGNDNGQSVEARIALLLASEQRASEQRKARRRRRIRLLTYALLAPLALLTLYAFVQYLRP